MRRFGILLLASTALCSLAGVAYSADLIIYDPEPMADQMVDLTLPAVSGPNGKIEFALGGITDPDAAIFSAGGSFSMPLTHSFGLQADIGFSNTDSDWSAGGALHLFTRDPSLYLLGVTGGVVVADGVSLVAFGPEAELYLDRVSIEAWAGWASANYDVDPLDEDGFFFTGDLAWYITDDWRVSVGGSSVLGEGSLRLATEYLFADVGVPLSATGELRAYEADRWSFKVGLKGYFGEDGKSLIDRHRQDDPPNRVLDLIAGGVGGGAECEVPDDLDFKIAEKCFDDDYEPPLM
jgi:hypothetical protein